MTPLPARTRITRIVLLGLVVALLPTTAAFADEAAGSGPLTVVTSSVARVVRILQSAAIGSEVRRAAIARVGEDLFDFPAIGRRALGPHWTAATPGEQEDFVELFIDVVQRRFMTSVDGYTGNNVTFVGETIDGPWAQVRTRLITPKGVAIAIDYRLHASNGRWAVYDIVSEGVSLVATYRNQLNAVILTSSFADLLDRMRSDRLAPRDAGAAARAAPDPVAAALFLGVFMRHVPTSH